ncbi:hypothetical protein HAX54_024292 [Datura stramonium]|uniref:Uncharacterized protein n=1 Tax=Datura stramonium TaxID=4076 RepID=A0ABS8UZ78_DATST|nr:hypothetical protein [Datura stramonium]
MFLVFHLGSDSFREGTETDCLKHHALMFAECNNWIMEMTFCTSLNEHHHRKPLIEALSGFFHYSASNLSPFSLPTSRSKKWTDLSRGLKSNSD